jgi:hypothetical protein
MFILLLSITPLIYLIYYWFLTRKSETISHDIINGYKCYSCKKDIDSFDNRVTKLGYTLSIEEYDELSKPTCCISCKRENKLNQVTKPLGFRYKIISDLDEFLVSDGYKKSIFILLSIIMFCLILDIIFREGRIFFYLGQSIQLFYWILFIRRTKLTSIKKPNQ